MLKYTDTQICFQEVPDEISICINISNCPCHCEGCHSSYLAEDIGTPLDRKELANLIDNNVGITCVAFMGGDSEPNAIYDLSVFIKEIYPKLKVAWYSGKEELPEKISLHLDKFDFIKLGPYKKDFGPLNKKTTNQRFYRVFHFTNGRSGLIDITHKFWKEDD